MAALAWAEASSQQRGHRGIRNVIGDKNVYGGINYTVGDTTSRTLYCTVLYCTVLYCTMVV